MIRLYAKDETIFDHNETILQPIKCVVTEEENGQFELEYESLPNTDIQAGSIIQAPTPRGLQLFRVYKPIHSLRKTKAKARHIFYDLMNNWLEDVRPTATSGSGAINSILGGTLYPHRFSGSSTVYNTSSAYYVRRNPVNALIGADNSLISRWGGYLQRDNFVLRHLATGRDLGYEIRYGKNLKGVAVEVDDSNVVTKLMPTWVNENNVVQMLPEKYLDSPLIEAYISPRVGEYRVNVPENTEDPEVYVREEALKQFSINNIDKPLINYKIDFVALRYLPEYKNFVWIEEVDLYDTVDIFVEKMGIRITSSVIRYSYDCIKERFTGIEIGNFSGSMARNTANAIREVDAKIEVKSEELTAKQIEATEKLSGVRGGNIVIKTNQEGKPYEIYVMDTDDISTARNVVRMNQNGIGFSKNGVIGPYSVAITVDGHIVADFIDTGVLNASILKAGVLADAAGKNTINMATGSINLANKIIYNPETNQFTIDGNMLVQAINGSASFRLDGDVINITGQTNIDNAVINTAHVNTLSADKLSGGAFRDMGGQVMLDTASNNFNIGNGSMQSDPYDSTAVKSNKAVRVENGHTMLEMNAGGYFVYLYGSPIGRLGVAASNGGPRLIAEDGNGVSFGSTSATFAAFGPNAGTYANLGYSWRGYMQGPVYVNGNMTVNGDVNITGRLSVNGKEMV